MNDTTNTSAAVTTDGKPIQPLIQAPDLNLGAEKKAETTKPEKPAASEKAAPKQDAANDSAPGLAPPPSKEEARKFAREFMLGELIKAVKVEFLPLPKPFAQLKEYEQESLLRRVQNRLETAAKEVVEIVAADGRLTFRADVDSVTFKDGVKAALKLAKTEHAHLLADQAGHSVLIVIEDFARYMNPGDETKGMPDQPSLFDKSQAARITDGAPPRKSPPKKKAKKPAGKKK